MSRIKNLFCNASEVSTESPVAAFASKDPHRSVTLTYGELYGRASFLAESLLNQGLQPLDRLLLIFPTSADYLIALLACRIAGFVAVPAYPPSGGRHMERLINMARDCEAAAVLTTSSGSLANKELKQVLKKTPGFRAWITTDSCDGVASIPDVAPLSADPERLFLIQYTSGSTGRPKGVVVTNGSLLHNLENQHLAMGAGLEGVNVSWLPFHHDMGLFGSVLQTLYWGAHTVYISPILFAGHPHRWLNLISEFRAVRSGGPNFAYQRCADAIRDEQIRGVDLSSWSIAFCGAEPIRAVTMEAFAKRFEPFGFRREALMPCYGMAEATLYVCSRRPSSGVKTKRLNENRLAGGNEVRQLSSVVSCGAPAGSMEIRIVDPKTTDEVADGVIGEIWVRGPAVAAGYWCNDRATSETFKARVRGRDNGGLPFLRTGDTGFLLEGELYVTGRLKEMIIVNGRNLFPTDIETLIERDFPELEPAHLAAVGHLDPAGRESLSIFAEVKRTAEIQDGLERRITKAVFQETGVSPSGVHLLRRGALPKTTSGKLRRTAMYDLLRQGALQSYREAS